METNIHFWSYLAQPFLEWEMFQTKVVQKIKTHILCSITFFFRKSYCFWDNVEKYCRGGAGHRWQYGACALHAPYLRPQTCTQNMFTAFQRQQWSHERASMLLYTYIASLLQISSSSSLEWGTTSPVTVKRRISCTAEGSRVKYHRLYQSACLKHPVSSSSDENPQFHIRAIFQEDALKKESVSILKHS